MASKTAEHTKNCRDTIRPSSFSFSGAHLILIQREKSLFVNNGLKEVLKPPRVFVVNSSSSGEPHPKQLCDAALHSQGAFSLCH